MTSQKFFWKSTSILIALLMALSLAMTASPAQAQEPTPTGGRIDTTHVRATGTVSLNEVKHLMTKESKQVQVMVEMTDEPTAVVYAAALESGLSAANLASVKQLSTIRHAQAALSKELTSTKVSAKVIYEAQRVYNGIAVSVNNKNLALISTLPGVKAIHPLIAKSMDNAYSVPLIGAPQVWQLGLGNRGDGVKVGVIDTGIDYLHTNFGGPGKGYEDNDTTVVGDAPNYPSVKVAGGYDLVGDAYDADNPSALPQPDFDPMDCNGHGSHVAGTIGGYGVQADGSTYMGSYGPGTDFAGMSIGPGVAPDVKLYGIRVFGCDGTTNVVTEALDWAVDPNGDGDFSDHLDVVNMSLGSSYGSPLDSDAVASDNAALAGVVVVASAGNSGDTYYVNGSPATATRAISVAASVDPADTWDGFQVTAPAAISGVYFSSNSVAYDWANSPDVIGDVVYPATNRGGCAAFPAGTFAGKVALIDWTHVAGGAIECGSVKRSTNAYNAGAIGVIMAEDVPNIDTAITGHPIIPATLTTLATGDALRARLALGDTVTVRFSADYIASVVNVDPSQTDTMTSFSSRGGRRYDGFLKPDITAPGMTIFSTLALSGTKGESLNGTSMAAPQIAGVMTLLRQLHPTWTVEELKALAMNTADHNLYSGASQTGDMYGPGRVGSGRVDAYLASQTQTVMYNSSDAGAVSVSFGAPEVKGTATATKMVTVKNLGVRPAYYNVSFEDRVTIPGVTYTLLDMTDMPLTQLVVEANSTSSFKVKMDAVASLMEHTKDATVADAQSGAERQYLSEAAGYIRLEVSAVGGAGPMMDTGGLHLPVYATPRPVSDMKAADTKVIPSGSPMKAELELTGTGLSSTTPIPVGINSLVTAFELIGTSPDDIYDPFDPAMEKIYNSADLQYVGAMSDVKNPGPSGPVLFFGLSTYGKWNSMADTEFDIYIDADRDGSDDYVLYNYNQSSATGGTDPNDVFVTVLVDFSSGGGYIEDYVNFVGGASVDTALFNNNVMVMPVYLADMPLVTGPMDFMINTYQVETGEGVDSTEYFTYDPLQPAIDTTDGWPGLPVYSDLPTSMIKILYDSTAQGGTNLLLLHHHNGMNSAEVVPVLGKTSYIPLVQK